MSTIQIQGLLPLKGEIEIQGSKNAVLPMMAASILHKGTTVLTHVPRIQDVFCMMRILEYLGCSCFLDGHELTIHTKFLKGIRIPETYVKSMRSSIMLLGALLGRTGEAITHYPGGCSIGKRPIDLHLYALRQLGASILEKDELIMAQAAALTGAEIALPYPSVGATENALLAAVLADGKTQIRGAAKEPEIEALCQFLNAMGAEITGIGTEILRIKGVKILHDVTYEVLGDRIVAGTYLAAVAAASGTVRLSGIRSDHMTKVLWEFEKMGMRLKTDSNGINMISDIPPLPVYIVTGPYPEFPTDLQSPVMALLSGGIGRSSIYETVFEGRYETVKELQKLGAGIIIEEKNAWINGAYPLRGGEVEAKDLRGGAALIIAGLMAEGETKVTHCHHILRGYEDICRDLKMLGAKIQQIN